MNKKIINILLRIPAPLIMLASWILSSKSTLEHFPEFWSADKLVHCVCFAGLAGAWTFWFSGNNWKRNFLRNFLICILIIAVYGAIDEFHQSFVPGRSSSVFDWMFDVLGGIIGTIAGRWIMIKTNSRV